MGLTAYIKQYARELFVDGDTKPLGQTRDGALQVNERSALVDLWTRDGRVWIANNPVIGQPETMSAAGTAFVLTAPSLRYTIPAGCVIVPIHVAMSGLQVITKDDLFGVIVSETDSYTSGGDAVAMIKNNAALDTSRTMRAGTSTVTNLHYSDTAIVEAALNNPRLLKRLKREGVAGEVYASQWNPEYNILKGDPMMYIRGPASFLVFWVQETTPAEAEWSMSWAVLEAGVIGIS